MDQLISNSVDGNQSVKDIWAKLQRTYSGTGNNMRVFQIKREISSVVQGDKTIQEYVVHLEQLWTDYDHFSPMTGCKDPECKSREIFAQERTMIQQESCRTLHSDATGSPGAQSSLATTNPSLSRSYGETRRCYNCGEVSHLSKAFLKPLKKRKMVDDGSLVDIGAVVVANDEVEVAHLEDTGNLTLTEEEEETGVSFTEEDHELLEMLRSKKLASDGASTSSSFSGNFATYAQSDKGTLDTRALASIPTTGTSKWIVDYDTSQYVKEASREFSTYTHLAAPESIQTDDGTAQPVVGKGIVKCTKSIPLANVLHTSSFPVKLLSISVIILQLKCIISFDIPNVTFQEKGTGQRLRTGSWRSGLWYLDRDRMNTALASMVDRVGTGGSGMSVEDELLLYHQRM